MPLDLPGPYDVGPEEAPWFLHVAFGSRFQLKRLAET